MTIICHHTFIYCLQLLQVALGIVIDGAGIVEQVFGNGFHSVEVKLTTHGELIDAQPCAGGVLVVEAHAQILCLDGVRQRDVNTVEATHLEAVVSESPVLAVLAGEEIDKVGSRVVLIRPI